MTEKLWLHEEVMLLALRDERGTIEEGAWYQQAVAGAVLAELVLVGRVRIIADGKRRLVEVVSGEPVGEPLADEWLREMAAEDETCSVARWVNKVSGAKDLKGRVARGLAERGILRVEDDSILMLFPRESYPEIDPVPEQALRGRMREAVIDGADPVDPRTSVLLSLARGTGLIELVFDRKELDTHQQRIEDIVKGEACGHAARELVAETHAAIVVSCIVPVVIT